MHPRIQSKDINKKCYKILALCLYFYPKLQPLDPKGSISMIYK